MSFFRLSSTAALAVSLILTAACSDDPVLIDPDASNGGGETDTGNGGDTGGGTETDTGNGGDTGGGTDTGNGDGDTDTDTGNGGTDTDTGEGDPAQGYYAGLPGVLYANVNEDAAGRSPVLFTEAVSLRYDNRIAALESALSSYRFALPPGESEIELDVRVIYRRAWRALADEKGWTEDGHGQPLVDLAPPTLGTSWSAIRRRSAQHVRHHGSPAARLSRGSPEAAFLACCSQVWRCSESAGGAELQSLPTIALHGLRSA